MKSKRKVELEKPLAKKPKTQSIQTVNKPKGLVKRKVDLPKPPAKKPKKNFKKQSKQAKAKVTKPRIYQPKFSVPPPRESSDEEEFNSAEDHAEEDLFNMNELVALAAQDKQRNGF